MVVVRLDGDHAAQPLFHLIKLAQALFEHGLLVEDVRVIGDARLDLLEHAKAPRQSRCSRSNWASASRWVRASSSEALAGVQQRTRLGQAYCCRASRLARRKRTSICAPSTCESQRSAALRVVALRSATCDSSSKGLAPQLAAAALHALGGFGEIHLASSLGGASKRLSTSRSAASASTTWRSSVSSAPKASQWAARQGSRCVSSRYSRAASAARCMRTSARA